MESRTDLPQRIPQALDLPTIDLPPVELAIQLAVALDEWDPVGGTRTDPTGPGTASSIPYQTAGQTLAGIHGGDGRLTLKEIHMGFALNAGELRTKVAFRKAIASNPSGNCVEVAELEDGNVAVRHSGAPNGVANIFTPGEWDAFLDGARNGEFDRQG